MVAFVTLVLIISVAYIYSKSEGEKATNKKQEELRKKNQENAKLNDVVKCPKCLSTQVSANKRGYTLTTGLFNSQDVYVTCLQCGHRWKAGG